ncbi:uncharacterized protein [Leptinotarsa decemlineata]|uniref:uncharacterized protein n=1 Tax=Leptinotarsa decemlineata TaxID=7539 RepID=UPI003D30B24A
MLAQNMRQDHPKVRQTAPENIRCRSEQSQSRRRPVTGALQQILERSLKNAGVTLSEGNPKPVDKIGNVRNIHYHQPQLPSKHWERSPLAFGDSSSRAVTAPHTQVRKSTIYDPIAKSIADYVTNNVPEKLHQFPWFKK